MDHDALSTAARRLHRAVEPIAANAYFSPEVNAAFAELGFGPGGGDPEGLVVADLAAYYTSRAGCMGQVPGPVVVAAFGVFNPAIIIPHVDAGWRLADRDAVLAARERGTTASLRRLLGDAPGAARATELLLRGAEAAEVGGHFLFAGLRSLGVPEDPIGALWRAADLVREHRGDSHIAAWSAGGLDGAEAAVVMELWAGMPVKTYAYSRGWATADLDAALDRLRARGLADGEPIALTPGGRALRDEIELDTDRQERPIIEAIGDDLEELLGILEPLAGAVVDGTGYPSARAWLPDSWGRIEE